MIKTETRLLVKSIVDQNPDGISLTRIHNKVQRLVTRLKLRCLLGGLYKNSHISRERVKKNSRSETLYYPFNGKPPVVRAPKVTKERDKKMLSRKDFLPGKKYAPYIEQ